jgi:hypothetical protein
MRISQEHAATLEKQGYVLIPEFLTEEELQCCQEEAEQYFPNSDDLASAPEQYINLAKVVSFPFAGTSLNQVTTHPDILDFLERSYGTDRLRLGESALQTKYGTRFGAGADQTLHNDTWGKKSLVYPRDDGLFRQTFMILYYTDVTADSAPTCVVPQEHSRTMDLLLTENGETTWDPNIYSDLYRKEIPVLAKAGSLLIFTGSTLHRGTAMRAETGQRLAHFLTYHAAHATWMENLAWPSGARPRPDSHAMQRFLEESGPRERELIGFPRVDDPYWSEQTLRGMAVRYPGMDLSPYREVAERNRFGAA